MAQKKESFHFQKYTYKNIVSAYIPSSIHISLSQDNEILCKPNVEIGEIVTEGQLIASNKKMGSYIHSPIPGIVKEIKECAMPNGTDTECIIISLKGEFSFTGQENKIRSWKYDTSSRIVTQIKQLGIINTLDSNTGSFAKQIESLTTDNKNLAVLLYDFDPSTSVCRTSTALFEKEIFEGSAICARAMNANAIIFFCDKHSIEKLKVSEHLEVLSDTKHYFIQVDCNLYPNASPLTLKKLIKKHKHHFPEISEDIGIAIDTMTALSLYNAIVYAKPLTETLVEVNGSALHESCIFSVKIGTPIKNILQEAGGADKVPAKIVVNGLLKGTAINDINVPVTKYLKSITVLANNSVPDQKKSTCIHCGLCREFCPAGLLPDVLYGYYKHSFNVQKEIQLSAYLCDECALCNTTCPSRLPLYQTISKIKEEKHETKV